MHRLSGCMQKDIASASGKQHQVLSPCKGLAWGHNNYYKRSKEPQGLVSPFFAVRNRVFAVCSLVFCGVIWGHRHSIELLPQRYGSPTAMSEHRGLRFLKSEGVSRATITSAWDIFFTARPRYLLKKGKEKNVLSCQARHLVLFKATWPQGRNASCDRPLE